MRVAIGTFLLLGWMGFAPPPMKMGLWELTSLSTSNATGKLADAMAQTGHPNGKPTTDTMKMCFTLESWEKSLGMGASRSGCTRTDVVDTPTKLSGKVSCTYGSTTVVADSTMYIDSPEKVHGTAHMANNSPGGTIVTDSTTTARFLSADCGDVKPIGSTLRR
jgi:hypothetical protein